MSVRSLRTPSYRLHKPTGQAVVTLCGRDLYLGKFGTRESRADYDRTIGEWLANGRILPRSVSGNGADITRSELLLAFLAWAESYYVKNGRMTGEVAHVRYAIKPVPSRFGNSTGMSWPGISGLSNSRRFARRSSTRGFAGPKLADGSRSLYGGTSGPWRRG